MKKLIIDSWAILAFFHKEEPYEKVVHTFKKAPQGKYQLLISIINLAEVYYRLIRKVGKEKANELIFSLEKIPLKTVPVSDNLVWRAAEIKAECSIALGDCFAVALALQEKAPILTGDPEFKKVEKFVKIKWL